MNVLSGSPRVDITISVNPQFELRLDHAYIQKREPTAADFDCNRLEIGHARFIILSEARISRSCSGMDSPRSSCCPVETRAPAKALRGASFWSSAAPPDVPTRECSRVSKLLILCHFGR